MNFCTTARLIAGLVVATALFVPTLHAAEPAAAPAARRPPPPPLPLLFKEEWKRTLENVPL